MPNKCVNRYGEVVCKRMFTGSHNQDEDGESFPGKIMMYMLLAVAIAGSDRFVLHILSAYPNTEAFIDKNGNVIIIICVYDT